MKGKLHLHRTVARGLSALSIAGTLGLGGGLLVAGTAPAQACNMESYIGSVCAFAFNWCPRNWLPADGRLIAINGNQALYSLIGTQYGGSVQSGQFGLPDLRGRAILHYGTGPGMLPQPFAAQSGTQTTTLNVSNLPPHNHAATFTGTGGGQQTVNVPADAGTLGVSAKLNAKDEVGTPTLSANSYLAKAPTTGFPAASIYAPSTSTSADVELSGLDVQLTGTAGHGAISFTYQSGITGGAVTTGNTGNGVAFSNQSPSLAMSYCIMINGLYPDRP
ncbi:phage tail protein [Stappia sp. P2PMeth1]|uniref:phage tail protein n=1 Tax=Stappia sp. P2PMeth1 TaxID=2003586 RepID=UPI001644F729|nr:tail fiber protein [Stappia sp. P2PMeth1]